MGTAGSRIGLISMKLRYLLFFGFNSISALHFSRLASSFSIPAFDNFSHFYAILLNSDTGVSINGGKMGVPKKGWFIKKKPIKMDDLGSPHLWKRPNGYV